MNNCTKIPFFLLALALVGAMSPSLYCIGKDPFPFGGMPSSSDKGGYQGKGSGRGDTGGSSLQDKLSGAGRSAYSGGDGPSPGGMPSPSDICKIKTTSFVKQGQFAAALEAFQGDSNFCKSASSNWSATDDPKACSALYTLLCQPSSAPSAPGSGHSGGDDFSFPTPPLPTTSECANFNSFCTGSGTSLQPVTSDRCLVVTPAGTSSFFSDTLYLTPVRSGQSHALSTWYGANSTAYVDGDLLFAESLSNGFRHALGPVSGDGVFCSAKGGAWTGPCEGSHGRQGDIKSTDWAQLANPQDAFTSLEDASTYLGPFHVGVWQGSDAQACLVQQSCSDARVLRKICQ